MFPLVYSERQKKNLLQTKRTLEEKLHKLWFEQTLHVPENTVINYSSFALSQQMHDLLKTGLKHPIPPRKSIDLPLQVQVEKLTHTLGSQVKRNHINMLKFCLEEFHQRVINLNNTPHHKSFKRTVKELRSNPDIRVCRFDKGQGVAILNTSDYMNKLYAIIDDSSKFKVVDTNDKDIMVNHALISDQSRLNRLLKTIKSNVDTSTFSAINPRGAQPGKLYGTVKVHKEAFPIRPIIASYQTAEYNLAKYLNNFITPVIPSQFSVQKNSDLLSSLNEYSFTANSKLVSFDVESLFTNVPLEETIQLAANLVYDSTVNPHPPFPKATFIKLLQAATGGLFLFDKKFYRQIDGLAMGSPLAPTLTLSLSSIAPRLADSIQTTQTSFICDTFF